MAGERWGKENIAKLRTFLNNRGINLVENADNLIGQLARQRGKTGGGAAFAPNPGGRPSLLLSRNPTRREVLHELAHYRDWRRLGEKVYEELGEILREQCVTRAIRNNRNWHRFNPEEQVLDLNNYFNHRGDAGDL